MNLKKLAFAGLISSISISACSPKKAYIPQTSSQTGIIGGVEVKPSYKIKESIVAVYDAFGDQLCTGSLLPNNIVLTAAHCVGEVEEDMYIYFGTSVTLGILSRPVDKVEVSPYWYTRKGMSKNRGDIALLHFQGKVPAGYKPATLLSAENHKLLTAGQPVIIAGYGQSNSVSEDGAGQLRLASVKIANPQFATSEITIDQTKGVGACHGDSGGPAYIVINGKYHLWGVTSRGVNDVNNDCSTQSAFTKILFYQQWINRMAAKLSSSLVNPDISQF